MIVGEKRSPVGIQILKIGAVVALLLGAIIARVLLYHVTTSDYTTFVSQWYDYIKSHNGFAAFKDDFYNYNPPYLYLLALTTYLPIPELIAIKSLSVVFDIVLSIFTYLLISLKYKKSYAAVIGALVLLVAPTIFINSAAWGQCDAIYTAFCLGSLYFLLTDRPWWACTFFALAFAFKLQAIFFFPVLLVLLLKRKLHLKYLIVIPVIFLLSLVPAFIAGRSAESLLTIYTQQITTGGVGGGQSGGLTGQFGQGGRNRSGTTGQEGAVTGGTGNTGQAGGSEGASGANGQAGGFSGAPGGFEGGTGNGQAGGFSGAPSGFEGGQGNFQGQFNRNGGGGGNSFSSSGLTYNAPSIYQWISSDASYWKWIGIILAGLFVVVVGILVFASKEQLTPAIILKFTLAFAVTIPFLLPEMHERYFYLADVLSIIYAFYFPRSFYVPIIVQFCSLSSYSPYFLNEQIVSLPLVAVGVLAMVIVTLIDLILTLYPNIRNHLLEPEEIEQGSELDVVTTNIVHS